jgi:hypothetical protein
MTVRNYRELIAWQRAMDLVEEVYKSTRLPEGSHAKRYTASPASSDVLSFRFLQISPKAREEDLRMSFFITCLLPMAR